MRYGNWSQEQLEKLADAFGNGRLAENICDDAQSGRLFAALVEEGFDLSQPEELEFGATIYYHRARDFALRWEDEIEDLCTPWEIINSNNIDGLYQVFVAYVEVAAHWASSLLINWLEDNDPEDVLQPRDWEE